MFDALIFDLDGTIIDSVPDVCASINRALDSMGRPPITIENTKELVRFGAHTLCDKALAITGEPGKQDDIRLLETKFLDNYRKNPSEHTSIFPGAVDALNQFRDYGIKLGICTNKPEATCFPVLDALKLRHYFSSIICGDTIKFKKPDPRHVYYTMNKMGAELGNTAFIGDSEDDIKAANNAGIPSVLVTFGYCHVPFDSLHVDARIDHYDKLNMTLRSIASKRSKHSD